jgi:hypothetical protein
MALQLDAVNLTGKMAVGSLQVGTSTTAGYVLTATDTSGNAVWAADTAPTQVAADRINADTTLDTTYGIVEFYGSTAAQTITLPQINGTPKYEGQRYLICNTSSVAVSIDCNGADQIGGGGAGNAISLPAGDRISLVAGPAAATLPTWFVGF